MPTTVYDLSACCCGAVGDDCSCFIAGTTPAVILFTYPSSYIPAFGSTCANCAVLNGRVGRLVQSPDNPCQWIEDTSVNIGPCGGAPTFTNASATVVSEGGHCKLAIVITGGSFVKDLGASPVDGIATIPGSPGTYTVGISEVNCDTNGAGASYAVE